MWGVMRPTVQNDFIYPRMFEVYERENRVHPALGLREPYRFSAGEEIRLSPPGGSKRAERAQAMRWRAARQSVPPG